MAKKTQTFFDAEGNAKRSADETVVKLVIDYGDDVGQIVVTEEDIGEKVRAAAVWHGLKQRLSDAGSGKDEATAFAEASEIFAVMSAEDIWTRQGEGAGPAFMLIAEAVLNVKAAAGDTSETLEQIAARYKGNKELKDKALSNSRVKAEYGRLQAVRAQERADKLAAAVKAEDQDVAGL